MIDEEINSYNGECKNTTFIRSKRTTEQFFHRLNPEDARIGNLTYSTKVNTEEIPRNGFYFQLRLFERWKRFVQQ